MTVSAILSIVKGVFKTVASAAGSYFSNARNIVVLALFAGSALLAVWAYYTVQSWHQASLQLAAVTAQRDQSRRDYADLDKRAAAEFSAISEKIDDLQSLYRTTFERIAKNGATVDAAIAAFKKDTANANVTHSDDDAFVRRRLLDLVAIPASAKRSAAIGRDGEKVAGLPAAAVGVDFMSGRIGTGRGRWIVSLPSPGRIDGCDNVRAVQGCFGRGDRRLDQRDRFAVSTARFFTSMPGEVMADEADNAQVLEESERAAGILRMQSVANGQASATGNVFCVDCDEEIPQARRRAVPSAVRCTECQIRHDRLMGG